MPAKRVSTWSPWVVLIACLSLMKPIKTTHGLSLFLSWYNLRRMSSALECLSCHNLRRVSFALGLFLCYSGVRYVFSFTFVVFISLFVEGTCAFDVTAAAAAIPAPTAFDPTSCVCVLHALLLACFLCLRYCVRRSFARTGITTRPFWSGSRQTNRRSRNTSVAFAGATLSRFCRVSTIGRCVKRVGMMSHE